MKTSAYALCLCVGILSVIRVAAAEAGQTKKLIEFGWDEPGPGFMRAHVAELEATPFDGCVFHADAFDDKGNGLPFTWQCWGKKAFKQSDLQRSLDDLKATHFQHFTHNFLRFNTTPADLDWFDDYSAVVTNAKIAATFARESGCAGILFDIEQYNQPLFNYPRQRDAKTKSWNEYAAQARKRGREVMEAFGAGYPDVTIFLTYGYSLPWRQARGDPARLSSAAYGLLAPFLDGMLDAAQGKSRIIDGYESSYGYKDTTRFATAYETMSKGVLRIVVDPEKYGQHFQFGFGVWMDNNSHRQKWDPQDFSKNFYTPDAFEKTVKAALERTDEYVWIYTEEPKWWTAPGKGDKLPDAYAQALKAARR
jgi:hypothetical protein